MNYPILHIIKDFTIIILLLASIFSLKNLSKLKLEIERLKLALTKEEYRRLNPKIKLELLDMPSKYKHGFFLKNESSFPVKKVTIEDINTQLKEAGFQVPITLRFEPIELLNSEEEVKLKLNVFDSSGVFLPSVTESIVPHLLNMNFSANVKFITVEGRKLVTSFCKESKQLFLEKVELIDSDQPTSQPPDKKKT
ncbi:hypothetical protein ACFL96_16725 [Thermoproteota archaeon]